MDRDHRLRRPRDFDAAYKHGRTASDGLLVVRARPNAAALTRVGVVAGKNYGNAVQRNRIKRRLRALARSLLVQPPPSGPTSNIEHPTSATHGDPSQNDKSAPLDAAPGIDIVIGVRRSAAGASHEQLRRSLAALIKRVAPGATL